MKKKIVSIILSICCLFAFGYVFSACSNNNSGRIKIVTTIFPEYDWTMNILGGHSEEVNIINLLNSGVDLHSYQPSVADITAIATCDLFIYVGGESDGWVEDALKNVTNKEMIIIKLLDVVGDSALSEEIKDGMQVVQQNVDDTEYDQHVWLSLPSAKVIVKEIAKVLSEIDAEYAEDYKTNAESYCEKLSELDLKYRQAVADAKHNVLVFADRFPFLYLMMTEI